MEASWLATYAEIEVGTAAARNAIEAHLAQLSGGEERDYWQAIAERYAVNDEPLAAEASRDAHASSGGIQARGRRL